VCNNIKQRCNLINDALKIFDTVSTITAASMALLK
jgi:hypothetical protein